MSSRLPTELQCLAQRMHATAQELALAAAQLPDMFAAATDWQPGQAVPAGCNRAAAEMLVQARTLEFDAQRLEYLAEEFTDHDRATYSHAMDLVDTCRMARAKTMEAPATADRHEMVMKLAGTVESGLANIQELLAERFPGETIPGG
jgi:hypothetical protein